MPIKLKPVKKEQVRIEALEGARPIHGTLFFYGFSGKRKIFKKNRRKGL